MLLSACAERPAPLVLPANVEGGWRLASSRVVPAERIQGLTPLRVIEGRYEGISTVSVTIYSMKSGTAAFELMQKWRRVDGSLTFQRGRFVVVAASPGGGGTALNGFARALEYALPEQ